MRQMINRIGQRFSRLSVVDQYRTAKYGDTYAICVCSCGKTTKVRMNALTGGQTKSCGCYNRERAAARMKILGYKKTHGMANGAGRPHNGAYASWCAMKQRCFNPKATKYELYGGAGIKVYSKWVNSFEQFLKDMGSRPDGCSLERLDSNKNYFPANCRWATIFEQNRNRRFKGHIYIPVKKAK